MNKEKNNKIIGYINKILGYAPSIVTAIISVIIILFARPLPEEDPMKLYLTMSGFGLFILSTILYNLQVTKEQIDVLIEIDKKMLNR